MVTFVSDIVIFVLKRDVKLPLTNMVTYALSGFCVYSDSVYSDVLSAACSNIRDETALYTLVRG